MGGKRYYQEARIRMAVARGCRVAAMHGGKVCRVTLDGDALVYTPFPNPPPPLVWIDELTDEAAG